LIVLIALILIVMRFAFARFVDSPDDAALVCPLFRERKRGRNS